MIPVLLMTHATRAFCLRWLKSNSNPTTNMKMQTPIWLNNCSVPSDSVGKMKPDAAGQTQPNSEGPSRMPAVISPITLG